MVVNVNFTAISVPLNAFLSWIASRWKWKRLKQKGLMWHKICAGTMPTWDATSKRARQQSEWAWFTTFALQTAPPFLPIHTTPFHPQSHPDISTQPFSYPCIPGLVQSHTIFDAIATPFAITLNSSDSMGSQNIILPIPQKTWKYKNKKASLLSHFKLRKNVVLICEQVSLSGRSLPGLWSKERGHKDVRIIGGRGGIFQVSWVIIW